MFSLIEEVYNFVCIGKQNIFHLELGEIIFVDKCIDNNIYYGHNLHLLECYRNKHINDVKNEICKKYNNVKFIFQHELDNNVKYNISTIYVLYNDYNIITNFIGLNCQNFKYQNILHNNI